MRTRLLLLAALLCGVIPAYAVSGRKVALRQDPLKRGLVFHRTFVSTLDGGANLLGTGSSTFTRASSATYLGADGLLHTASSGIARFDYGAAGNGTPGLLVEAQSTNLALKSQAFSDATWGAAGLTATDNAVTSPDGGTTGSTLISSAGGTFHFVGQTCATTNGNPYTLSAYCKANGYNWVFLDQNNAGRAGAAFNLSAGTIGTVHAGITASMISLGNGWYRCAITRTAVGATMTPEIFLSTADYAGGTFPSFSGDGVSGISAYGGQFEAGSLATSYIPTVAATVTRAADVLTYPSEGNVNTNGSFTVSVWVYLTANPAFQYIVSQTSDGTNAHSPFQLWMRGTIPRFDWQIADGTTTGDANNGSGVALNTWHHLVGYYDANAKKIGLYVDGGAPFTTSFDNLGYSVTTAFQVGSYFSGSQFDGNIRDLRIYSRVLSAGEVATLKGMGY